MKCFTPFWKDNDHTNRTTLAPHEGKHISCAYVCKDEEGVLSGGEMCPVIGSLLGEGQEL